MMERKEKPIDIEKAIRSSDNKLIRSLPGFIINAIRRLICEEEINSTIIRSSHLDGMAFARDVLEGWQVEVKVRGEENLDNPGRIIIASNHPVGGVDALSLLSVLQNHIPEVRTPANQLLYQIPNMRSMVFGLDVFGKTSRETAKKLDQLYESDIPVMIFPAGEVSRKNKGVISDIVWQKSFIAKAVQHHRDIIPVHISGRNSSLFYNLALLRKRLGIRMYIETLLLPREMIKQRGRPVTVTFGEKIPYQMFTPDKSAHEWAQHVKSVVYSLPGRYEN